MSRMNIILTVLAIAGATFGTVASLAKRSDGANRVELSTGEPQAVLQFKSEIARLDKDRLAVAEKLHHQAKERDEAVAVLEKTAKEMEGLRNQLRGISNDFAKSGDREVAAATELASAREQTERMALQLKELVAKSEDPQPSNPTASVGTRLPGPSEFPLLLFRYNRFAKKLEVVLAEIRTPLGGDNANREKGMAAVRTLLYEVQCTRGQLDPNEVEHAEYFLADLLRKMAAQ